MEYIAVFLFFQKISDFYGFQQCQILDHAQWKSFGTWGIFNDQFRCHGFCFPMPIHLATNQKQPNMNVTTPIIGVNNSIAHPFNLSMSNLLFHWFSISEDDITKVCNLVQRRQYDLINSVPCDNQLWIQPCIVLWWQFFQLLGCQFSVDQLAFEESATLEHWRHVVPIDSFFLPKHFLHFIARFSLQLFVREIGLGCR